MDESRRLAMRRAHARRANYCTCGQTVHGNGGKAAHKAMHVRKNDGHHYMSYSAYQQRVAADAKAAKIDVGEARSPMRGQFD